MRKVIVLLMCAGLVNCSYARKKSPEFEAALVRGAQMRMILRVHDDDGLPVKSAKVRTIVENLYTIYNICGETDTNGTCVVEGLATGNRIEIFIEKDGYYRTHRQYCFITMGAEREVKDGKWQPYGAEERLELRKIQNPVDLVTFNGFMDVPATNLWIGLDLAKKDFVKPFGMGSVSDLELKAEWDGLPAYKSRFCRVDFRFPAIFSDGYYSRNVEESSYPYIYEADSHAKFDVKKFSVVDRNGNPYTTAIPFPVKSSLIVRCRPVVGEDDKLESVNYGDIRRLEVGPSRRGKVLLRLSYVFNPTPNDTNLEAKQ